MKEKFGAWLARLMEKIHLFLVEKKFLVIPRDEEWYYKTTREELIKYSLDLEEKKWKAEEDATRAWSRYENAISLARSYMNNRVAICRQLERFNMLLDGDNKIVVQGPRMHTNPNEDWSLYWNSRTMMVPIMASGLVPPPIPPFSTKKKPIICWYRVIPDEKIKGKLNEEFSHYEDMKVVELNPKSKKKETFVELPKTNVPSPRGGTKFTGKWTWKLKYRTDELSPRILDEETLT